MSYLSSFLAKKKLSSIACDVPTACTGVRCSLRGIPIKSKSVCHLMAECCWNDYRGQCLGKGKTGLDDLFEGQRRSFSPA